MSTTGTSSRGIARILSLPEQSPVKRRLTYIGLALGTIAIGLLVHLRGSSLGASTQDITGDVLYAIMIAWWVGALVPHAKVIVRALAAFAICATIEFSQLSHAPVFEALRSTRLGQLVLGTGFDTRDLWAYAAGVCVAVLLEAVARRGRTRSGT